ncbi:hypothetical protein QR680_015366 [Steinernema hermaphroditum]|uniref:Uncharacterized protein n=1 Tax=Steinernema hermaphroditum TaxID=289476 RepID=A0AA39H9C9_9BILA|nr:hypothetical protein QR680_015366 [Steinernema hermaphroditum]
MLPFCTENNVLSLESEAFSTNDSSRTAFYIGVTYISMGVVSLPVNFFVLFVFALKPTEPIFYSYKPKDVHISMTQLVHGESSYSFPVQILTDSRPPLINEPVYKLLTITSVLDILNLITGCFVCGLASLFNASYCVPHWEWLLPYSVYFMAHWYAYCAAAEVLAINRLLVFAKPALSTFLFSGRKPWLWLIFIIGYSVVGTVIKPTMFYAYVPAAGVIFDSAPNLFHIYNNMVKLVVVTACYLLMIVLLVRMKHGVVVKAQRSLSILTFIVAVFGAAATAGYLTVSYWPISKELSKYTGLIAQLGWILLHAFTGYVYLIGNKTVRQTFVDVVTRRNTKVFVSSVQGSNKMFRAR